jgi:hypothetical protein
MFTGDLGERLTKFFRLEDFPTLRLKAESSTQSLLSIYHTTPRHISEHSHFHFHRCDNLKNRGFLKHLPLAANTSPVTPLHFQCPRPIRWSPNLSHHTLSNLWGKPATKIGTRIARTQRTSIFIENLLHRAVAAILMVRPVLLLAGYTILSHGSWQVTNAECVAAIAAPCPKGLVYVEPVTLCGYLRPFTRGATWPWNHSLSLHCVEPFILCGCSDFVARAVF